MSFVRKGADKKNQLNMHVRRHRGEKPSACTYCQYTCTESCDLKRHERRHTGAKPYQCRFCHLTFSQSCNHALSSKALAVGRRFPALSGLNAWCHSSTVVNTKISATRLATNAGCLSIVNLLALVRSLAGLSRMAVRQNAGHC